METNVIMFVVDKINSVHAENQGSECMVLSVGSSEVEYIHGELKIKCYNWSISRENLKVCLSSCYHYNNSYMHGNGKKIVKFKAKQNIGEDVFR